MFHVELLLFSILYLNPKCIAQLAQERLHLGYNDIFIAKNNCGRDSTNQGLYLKRYAPILTFHAQHIWVQYTGNGRNIFEVNVKETSHKKSSFSKIRSLVWRSISWSRVQYKYLTFFMYFWGMTCYYHFNCMFYSNFVCIPDIILFIATSVLKKHGKIDI